MPKKIVHIITNLSVGGAEMMLFKITSSLKKRKFDIIVVSLMDKGTIGDALENIGIPVISLCLGKKKINFTKIVKAIKFLQEFNPDILQGWMYHGNVAASFLAFFIRKKTLVYYNIRQCLYDIKKEKKMTQIVIRAGGYLSKKRCMAVVYNSRVSGGQHGKFGYSLSKQVFIPNGFDFEKFKPSMRDRRAIRKELNVPEVSILIGIIARVHEVKDYSNFLKAGKEIIQKEKNVQFVCVGRGVSWNNPTLSSFICENNLEDYFHLLGERVDISSIMSSLDILVSSSRAEGFPNVIGEAMASGVPCVATDVGDCAWIIQNTGVLVPAGDSLMLAKACLKLIQNGGAYRRKLGQRARSRIKTCFPLEKVAQQYESLYDGKIDLKEYGKACVA